MKIKVVQMVYGKLLQPDSWFQYVEKINRLYCNIHGYEYVVVRYENIREDRHGNWMKVDAIRDNLSACDYLLSLEADCAVYCHSIALEEDVIPHLQPGKSVLTTNNNLCSAFYNEGQSAVWSMLFRNDHMVRKIIEAWDTAHQAEGYEQFAFSRCYDEDGWRRYVVPLYKDSIQTLDDYYLLTAINGYFIRHLALTHDELRLHEFKRMWESPMMQRNISLLRNKQLRGFSS